MKTKNEISGHFISSGAWAVFFLAPLIAPFLLFIAMPAAALAVDAVWNPNPSSSVWNDDFNWTPPTAPEHAGETATFNSSTVTHLSLSSGVAINSITFNPGASAFSIDTSGNSFSIGGAGIINNSGVTQRIVNEADGTTSFFHSSTADNASLVARGGADCCPFPVGSGSISFFDTSTAGNAGLVAGGGANAGGGSISFSGNSSAADATLTAEGGTSGAGGPFGGGGSISFSDNSTAGNATLTAKMGLGTSGTISFSGNSSAGYATLTAEGGPTCGTCLGGAVISFSGSSTAGNATITSDGGTLGGRILFRDQSTGGTASVEVSGHGELDINHSVTMGSIIITSNLPGLINLNFTGPPSVIRSLVVNGVAQPPGIYGSPTSGAPHQLPQLAGPGAVRVGIVAPTIATNTVGTLTSFSATLNGTVNPNGLTTNVHFQYGRTTSYGHTTPSHSYTGDTTQAVSANVAELSPNTTYHFRLVGINNAGITYGSDRTFTTLTPTGPPVVTTNPASNIAISSATLNGSLNPHGLTTTVYFQYGTTTSYGLTTPQQTQAGNTYRNISANISGLPANSAYHFRIVATNSAGTKYGADRVVTIGPNDFNNDGRADYLLFNPTTRGTVIWYMNNNVYVGAMYGPPVPEGWEVAGVADFNLGSHPDYLLLEPATRSTVILYMNNNVRIGSTYGATLPSGWSVGALADFNGDGYPDYLLYNASTGGTVVWYMRNNVHIGSAPAPTLPGGWSLRAVADFNGDGRPDYLLFSPVTRQTVIWYMSGATHTSSAAGPTIEAGWEVVGAADFDHNARPDYVLYNSGTHQTAIWYLNNNIFLHNAGGPILPAGWTLVAP